MYECPNCGGNLKFDIPSQQLACAHCGTHLDPYAVKKETDATEQDYFEATVFTCPQCAGEIFSTDNEAAAFCSFCGASTILTSRISREKRPKFIIPFKKTKEDCKNAYAQTMRRAFFVPKELKDPKYIDGFRGIYMPYWTYQLTQKGRVTLSGEKTYRRGDYVITDHYDLSGDLDAYYLGYSYDASSSFYDNISEALAPYDAKELVNFTPAFLSGFYADTADIGEEVYRQDAIELANDSTLDRISKDKAFSGYHINSSKGGSRLGTKLRSADNTMYPVWFLSYRNGDRIAYATVNGQTGKVVADMPISPIRYLFASLVMAVPIYLLLNLFFTIRPPVLMGIACVLALVSGILYIMEMNAIGRKETNEDDRAIEIIRRKKQEDTAAAMEAGKAEKEREKTKRKNTSKKKNKLGKPTISFLILILYIICYGQLIMDLANLFLWPVILIAMVVCLIVGICRYKKVEDVKGLFGFIFATAAVLISGLIRLFHPVSDIPYYIGAILTLLADTFIFVDIIRNYNKLAMRRLPQFDKQGGDDRA